MAAKIDVGSGSLWNGDCLEMMADVPDGSVDMVLCDLPYGTTACKWDAIISFDELWAEYLRIAKRRTAIVLTASQPFTTRLGASNLPMLKYSWVWEKARPTNFMHAKRMPLKGFEDILVFYREAPTYNPQGTTTCSRVVKNGGTKSRQGGLKANGDVAFTGHLGRKGVGLESHYSQSVTGYPRGIVKFAQDGGSYHPTQKPVALFEYLIRTYTNPGDLVLDNCSGSGTTAIAAERSGRRWLCIERDPTYYTASLERIKNHIAETAEASRQISLLDEIS